ncbi:hypothetical protein [Nocardiopsis protaetiae]|uniref:hypothetical protein n=1 Tax=Nocardiopsis protaetiae TaxID=3382270 RepID=UPI00387B4918
MPQIKHGMRLRITRTTPNGTSVWVGQALSDPLYDGFLFAKDGGDTGQVLTDEGFAEYVRTTWRVKAHQVTEVL